jgi:biopolymer transport protein ExbD
MAGFDLNRPKKSSGKALGARKRGAKRIGIRIDMTPMVDIAFLLLIFYMVTTFFSMPQSLELNLPPVDAKIQPVKESRVLNIWVDSEGQLYWLYNKSAQERMLLPEPIALKSLRGLLIDKNREVEDLIVVLKIDPLCRYEVLIDIVDEVQYVERMFKQIDPQWSYTFTIDDISEWEMELMAGARKLNENVSP